MEVKRVTVRLTREEKQMLLELANKNRTSMTEMVRRMIDEEFDRRWPGEPASEAGEASDRSD